jgi:O-acetyl-ADP-ribose deacetylase (regulator of RNase III)
MTAGTTFSLSARCTLALSLGDITRWQGHDPKTGVRYQRCVVVNAANETLLGGGGVDGAIHRAAGPGLLDECRQFEELRPGVRCEPGQAKVTSGHQLPASQVIHTVGPRYVSDAVSAPVLMACYRASIEAAEGHKIQAIAFPAISCGAFGYPNPAAAEIAVRACARPGSQLQLIEFVLFDSRLFDIWSEAATLQLGPGVH